VLLQLVAEVQATRLPLQSGSIEPKVDRLLPKTMANETPKAQAPDGKAAVYLPTR
jgi:hypothetical protein